jgi:hypothetical protein
MQEVQVWKRIQMPEKVSSFDRPRLTVLDRAAATKNLSKEDAIRAYAKTLNILDIEPLEAIGGGAG